MQTTSNKCHGRVEGVVALWETTGKLPIHASLGNRGADRSKGLSVCLPRGGPILLQCPFSILLRKLNVVVTKEEMLNETVSILAVHMSKAEFGVESH